MRVGSRIRLPLLIVSAFWAYGAALDILRDRRVFTLWTAHLVQHLLLYPVLLFCVATSLLIGWKPIRRRLPLQALLGAGFAALVYPAFALGLRLMGSSLASLYPHGASIWELASSVPWHLQLRLWSGTLPGFFLEYAFAVGLATGFDIYRQLCDSQIRSAALERELGAAHLAALRMQLSPHSLFNLLHTIRGQIEWDPDAARTMIVQLGELLRRLLSAGEREYSRLADEIQFARLYLELQQRRFADRLAVQVPSAAGLPAAWVPSLILQPLIENAVVHGLAGHQGPVTVDVTAGASQGLLTLRVTNTMSADRPRQEGGIGLRNVRDRLAIQFASRAAFDAAPDGHGRWVAEIRMPCLPDVLAPSAATGVPG